jgi:predicted ATPase
MLLEISNIGKIQSAKIEMRGMTVIAGNNNTGKSTFGKILYCMFNAFCNAEAAIQKERKHNFQDIFFRYFRQPRFPISIRTFINSIMEHLSSQEEIRGLFEDAINNKIISADMIENDTIDSFIEKILRSAKVSDDEIQKTILAHILRDEFDNQIVHVNHSDEPGNISLNIKRKMLAATIKDNECVEFIDNVGIIYNALYVDTPFVMDELDRYKHIHFSEYRHREYLLRSLCKPADNINVIDEVLVKQQLQNVLLNIRNVIDGEFKENEETWVFQEAGLKKPLGFFNISTGMKPFLIIKRLLEAGEIKEQGVLIFDEPEIHLHPEWQIKYAELLVLLQKEFDVNILLTTHSPYFLNAIEVYSQKYDVLSHCNYYLTENSGDTCIIKDVTANVSSIYQKLAEPFQKLENIRYGNN